jgi:hypothetical protein
MPHNAGAVRGEPPRETRELDYMNLGDWLWAMLAFFFWVMAFWIFLSCFMDLFRRDDLGGGMKAVWVLILFILPFLGCLIYMITRPKVTMTDVKSITAAEAAGKAVAQVSTADELTKLAQLRDAGVVSAPEYEKLKAKLLA